MQILRFILRQWFYLLSNVIHIFKHNFGEGSFFNRVYLVMKLLTLSLNTQCRDMRKCRSCWSLFHTVINLFKHGSSEGSFCGISSHVWCTNLQVNNIDQSLFQLRQHQRVENTNTKHTHTQKKPQTLNIYVKHHVMFYFGVGCNIKMQGIFCLTQTHLVMNMSIFHPWYALYVLVTPK